MDGTKLPLPSRAMVDSYSEDRTLNGVPEVHRKPRLFDPENLSQFLNLNPFEAGSDFSKLLQSDFRNVDPETQQETLLFMAYRFVIESIVKK
ncbi:MAG TPA: hypothetical protein VF797_06500 [Noviherbaspirillum sp.]